MTDGALLAHLRAARDGRRVTLAVSGGSDSLAMLYLTVAAEIDCHAVTIDHRLRVGSDREAAVVADHCARLGVPHAIVAWEHGEIHGNLQDAARKARYRLLSESAARQGPASVWIAHTADDQAECVLMGLARAAGVDGLSGMRASWTDGSVRFVRPLLSVTRSELRSSLQGRGVDWVDDPSNDDPKFLRVRARAALPALADIGVTVETLAQVAGNLAAVRAVLQAETARAANDVANCQPGRVTLRAEGFATLAPEIRRRLLSAALCWVTDSEHPPRAEALGRLLAAIESGHGGTLHGCLVRISGGLVSVAPEFGDCHDRTDFPATLLSH